MLATRNFSSKCRPCSPEKLFRWILLVLTTPDSTSHYHNLLFLRLFLSRAQPDLFNLICKGKSMIAKKSDGSQVKEKESTDSSTTIEDDDVKGKSSPSHFTVLVTMIKFAARAQKVDWIKRSETFRLSRHVQILRNPRRPLVSARSNFSSGSLLTDDKRKHFMSSSLYFYQRANMTNIFNFPFYDLSLLLIWFLSYPLEAWITVLVRIHSHYDVR